MYLVEINIFILNCLVYLGLELFGFDSLMIVLNNKVIFFLF